LKRSWRVGAQLSARQLPERRPGDTTARPHTHPLPTTERPHTLDREAGAQHAHDRKAVRPKGRAPSPEP
jgi:hypothetical protein